VIKKPQHEEAKARYRAAKIQRQWVVTPGKQTFSVYEEGEHVHALIETF
jgi:hypothetical protein